MKRLTEEEIKKVLAGEYMELERRKLELLGDIKRLEEDEELNDKEIHLAEDLIADKIRAQCEVVRMWKSFFNKDFRIALNEIIEFSEKVSA